MGPEGQAPKDHWYRPHAVPQDRLPPLQERFPVRLIALPLLHPFFSQSDTGRTPLPSSAPRRQHRRHKRHYPCLPGGPLSHTYMSCPLYTPRPEHVAFALLLCSKYMSYAPIHAIKLPARLLVSVRMRWKYAQAPGRSLLLVLCCIPSTSAIPI